MPRPNIRLPRGPDSPRPGRGKHDTWPALFPPMPERPAHVRLPLRRPMSRPRHLHRKPLRHDPSTRPLRAVPLRSVQVRSAAVPALPGAQTVGRLHVVPGLQLRFHLRGRADRTSAQHGAHPPPRGGPTAVPERIWSNPMLTATEIQRLTAWKLRYESGLAVAELRRLTFIRWLVAVGRVEP